MPLVGTESNLISKTVLARQLPFPTTSTNLLLTTRGISLSLSLSLSLDLLAFQKIFDPISKKSKKPSCTVCGVCSMYMYSKNNFRLRSLPHNNLLTRLAISLSLSLSLSLYLSLSLISFFKDSKISDPVTDERNRRPRHASYS